jgi:hypothetical protein
LVQFNQFKLFWTGPDDFFYFLIGLFDFFYRLGFFD